MMTGVSMDIFFLWERRMDCTYGARSILAREREEKMMDVLIGKRTQV